MRTPTLPLILLLILAFAAPLAEVRAQQNGGKAGTLMRTPLSPREIALGGIPPAFDIDASATFSMAAALSSLESPSAAAVWSSPLFGVIGMASLSAAIPLSGAGAVGVSITSRTTGDQKGYTASRTRSGTIVDRELSLSLGGAIALGPGSVGATVHLLRRDITGTGLDNSGYAVDISGTLAFDERLYLGVSLSEIAGEMISGESALRETMPWQARLSAAYVHPLEEESQTVRPDPTGEPLSVPKRPRSYVLAAAGARIVGEDLPSVLSVAAEAVPLAAVPVGFRLGVNDGGEISGGFFYRMSLDFAKDLRLDYAIRWFESPSDVTHHAGLSVSF